MIADDESGGVRIPRASRRGATPGSDPDAPADVQLALRLKVVNKRRLPRPNTSSRASTRRRSWPHSRPHAPRFSQQCRKPNAIHANILLLIGNSYYDALTQNNGELAPFADDCGRRENGMHTAGVGRPSDAPAPPAGFGDLPNDCAGQLTSRAMSYINSIDLRRIWIADEEHGLVVRPHDVPPPDGTEVRLRC